MAVEFDSRYFDGSNETTRGLMHNDDEDVYDVRDPTGPTANRVELPLMHPGSRRRRCSSLEIPCPSRPFRSVPFDPTIIIIIIIIIIMMMMIIIIPMQALAMTQAVIIHREKNNAALRVHIPWVS